jgi:hypothetical protein
MRSLFVATVMFLASGSSIQTADCLDKKNLLAATNCGFAKDVSGWRVVGGATVAREALPGGGGAMKVKAGSDGSITVIGPCVSASPSVDHEVSARIRSSAGIPYFCSVLSSEYTDVACKNGANPLAGAGVPPAAEWQTATARASTSGTTRSIQISAVCSGEPGFSALFDDFAITRK